MRDDGRPGLGHIGGVEVCEVHGEEEEQGRRAPQAVRHKLAEIGKNCDDEIILERIKKGKNTYT